MNSFFHIKQSSNVSLNYWPIISTLSIYHTKEKKNFEVFSFFSYKLWNVYLSKWLITINCQRRQYLSFWLGLILSTSIMDMKPSSTFFFYFPFFFSFFAFLFLPMSLDFWPRKLISSLCDIFYRSFYVFYFYQWS